MIEITTEVNGKKYELVKYDNGNNCDKCALKSEGCTCVIRRAPRWEWYTLCITLNGVWKEKLNEI